MALDVGVSAACPVDVLSLWQWLRNLVRCKHSSTQTSRNRNPRVGSLGALSPPSGRFRRSSIWNRWSRLRVKWRAGSLTQRPGSEVAAVSKQSGTVPEVGVVGKMACFLVLRTPVQALFGLSGSQSLVCPLGWRWLKCTPFSTVTSQGLHQ